MLTAQEKQDLVAKVSGKRYDSIHDFFKEIVMQFKNRLGCSLEEAYIAARENYNETHPYPLHISWGAFRDNYYKPRPVRCSNFRSTGKQAA